MFELSSPVQNLVERINLGAPAAENEASILGAYYVATDEYNKALSGMTRFAVGRKGSGKTALFFRLRDKVRNDRQNVVLDLKPDGYQLKRFKFMVLDLVDRSPDRGKHGKVSLDWTIRICCESFCAAELSTA